MGLSVHHDREPCKNGLTYQDAVWTWTHVHPRNHILDEGPDAYMWRGNFEGEKEPGLRSIYSNNIVQGHRSIVGGNIHSVLLCCIVSKWLSNGQHPAPIWCRCWLGSTRWVHICTTWWIWLKCSCVAAMKPYVRLHFLWPWVSSTWLTGDCQPNNDYLRPKGAWSGSHHTGNVSIWKQYKTET